MRVLVSRIHPAGYAFALLVLSLPFVLWGSVAARDETVNGLRVAGTPLDPTADPEPELQARADRWLARDVQLDAGRRLRRLSRAELGVRVDVRAVSESALRTGRSGDPFADLRAIVEAGSGGVDLEWPIRVDEEVVREVVDELAHEIDRPARGAELDDRGRVVTLSADGARLDRPRATALLLETLMAGGRNVRLPVERISSGLGQSALATTVRAPARPVSLSRYVTDLRSHGSNRSRAHNVATAADYLDGAVIPAGGRLSFNRRVGARSRERGYRDAHVIVNGEMVDGIGGGVCQVASTLHAAAFLAGLNIVEHTPHSRPSDYIPMGLDATVVWPNVDLEVENPNPFPVQVRARADDRSMLVELYGQRQTRRVEWRRDVLSTEDWHDRFVEDPAIEDGDQRVTQRGIRGRLIYRERTIVDSSGVHVEATRIRYPPTPRIVHVAVGSLDPYSGVPDNPF